MAAGESARRRAVELRTQAEQLLGEAKRFEQGAEGEERVAEALKVLDPARTRVLHDRLLVPGKSSNLDHIVVAPSGVYLVDAKNWGGTLTEHQGSLWQHLGSGEHRQHNNKSRDLAAIRSMAAKVSQNLRHTVTPVLCLASPARQLPGPREIAGVHVVGVDELGGWLESRPAVLAPDTVSRVAANLACDHPSAVNAGLTLHALASEPSDTAAARPSASTAAHRRFASDRRSGSSRARRRRSRRPVRARRPIAGRALVALLVLAAVFTLAPKLPSLAGRAVGRIASHAMPAKATPGVPAANLTSPQQQALDDWRISAGLYEAHDQPAELPYVPDTGLGYLSSQCRDQGALVAHYRPGLLRAPDASLRTAASSYDRADKALLHACVVNDPVALHHARVHMTTAASDANARYNRLLGVDPLAVTAARVL